MASADLTPDEIAALNAKNLKSQMKQAEKCINSITAASYVIEKAYRRFSAIELIKEIEKGTDKHAIGSILDGIRDAIQFNFIHIDMIESNAVFDVDPNEKEYLTIQNSSICLSDSEDIEIPNPKNNGQTNKSYHITLKNPDQEELYERKATVIDKAGNLTQFNNKLINFEITVLFLILYLVKFLQTLKSKVIW